MWLDTLKQCVPTPLRRVAREAWRARRWRTAMLSLTALEPGRVPGRRLLGELRATWDNPGFAADLGYLSEVAAHAARTPGPVLECGSGLTTVLLAALAARRGVEVWTVEHDPSWFSHTTAVLRRHRLTDVRVCLAPLRQDRDFTWYDAPLQHMPEAFRLVVCDGPPSTTPGGRYGLFPVLDRRLPSGTRVLLDDAARAAEADAMSRWVERTPLRVEWHRSREGTYAVITVTS
jgi:predicted O-methyltransferase YrrM